MGGADVTTAEEFGSEVGRLIGDYRAFVVDLLERLDKEGIDTKDRHITHLLYRTAEGPEYERLRDGLRPLCREFVETVFNGRTVSVMTLRHPLELPDGHSVTMIELPAPRTGRAETNGLDSMGVMIGSDIEDFEQQHNKVVSEAVDLGHGCKMAIIRGEDGKMVKFLNTPLRDVVMLEGWHFEEPLEPADATENRVAGMVNAWRRYLYEIGNDWETLIKGVKPKQTGCGPVYEIPNLIRRPNESFAIADMRGFTHTDAHYHAKMTEVYMVLEGRGTVVVGGEEHPVEQDATVVIAPGLGHFTLSEGLVLALINTPPFEASDYLVLAESKPEVRYDKAQYERMTKEA